LRIGEVSGKGKKPDAEKLAEQLRRNLRKRKRRGEKREDAPAENETKQGG
jgi:ribosome-associated translation inhibitor RaiA